MNLSGFRWPRSAEVVAWGLLAFAVLTIRFSPNWSVFRDALRNVKAAASNQVVEAAVEKAFLSGYSTTRGLHVARQAVDPGTEIEDPNHKIIRWRLLMPYAGHYLSLPLWMLFGLAHLGCLILVIAFVALGTSASTATDRAALDAVCFGVIAGSSAPFFASMGWLGYYDSLLAVGLLAVAFTERKWLVLAACLLTPWLDERFVIGLPLALWVRRVRSEPAGQSDWDWFKEQAALPLLVASLYSVVRLGLGGTGGSQTVVEYLAKFVFPEKLSVEQRLIGIWEGLRVGWILVFAAAWGYWRHGAVARQRRAILLAGCVAMTGCIGLFAAQDMARSMVLLIPVVPLGWTYVRHTAWWRQFNLAPILAIAALVIPAHHIIGNVKTPVSNLYATNVPLMEAFCNLGVMYATGQGVPSDRTEAAKWYRLAAERGYAQAQHNLGVMYANGEGVSRDGVEAMKWYRRAAAQGYARAQANLGVMYAKGESVTKDSTEAVRWLRKSAEQGYAFAQTWLGVIYAIGDGVPKDSTEAAKWYRKAAEQGLAEAQFNLGVKYANGDGVPRDSRAAAQWYQQAAAQGLAQAQSNLGLLYAAGDGVKKDRVQAAVWWILAGAQGHEEAKRYLALVEIEMSTAEKTAAWTVARDLIEKLPGKK